MTCPTSPATSNLSLARLIGQMKAFAHREPIQALAIAVGTGLILQLLPKRAIVSTATTLGSALLHPTLLTLGLTKALEVCFPTSSTSPSLLPLFSPQQAGYRPADFKPASMTDL
jgi:hypothetical protein